MQPRSPSIMPPAFAAVLDPRLLAWTAAWALVSGLAFGLVSAIIPNPVFGRQIPPEPFAIAVWLVSAPIMGLVLATYTSPPSSSAAVAASLLPAPVGDAGERRSTRMGGIAAFGAFLAIGCPVCNKVALLLLGASGALSIYAPLQPLLGAASLALLLVTAGWRLRLRARGGACPA